MLPRHVESPKKHHQVGVLKLLKCLKKTMEFGLMLKPGTSKEMCAYVDANRARERGSGRRSRTGIAVFFSDVVVYYTTTLQKCITLSSTEAEFVVMSECTKVVLWLRRVLHKLDLPQDETCLFEDSVGAVTWSTGHSIETD